MYAHNGGKYDLGVLIQTLFKRKDFGIDKDSFVELGGAVISMTIKNEKGTEFTFRDSARIIPDSLDTICKAMKPYYRKQSEHKFKFEELNE